jgi:hypothetical protein
MRDTAPSLATPLWVCNAKSAAARLAAVAQQDERLDERLAQRGVEHVVVRIQQPHQLRRKARHLLGVAADHLRALAAQPNQQCQR